MSAYRTAGARLVALRGKTAPATRPLRSPVGSAVFAPAGIAPALAPAPAPAATAPATGPMAAPWAAMISAGLHATAALALVAVPVLFGAGAAGNGGLDSASRPEPSALQVTLMTPADLLPQVAPQVPVTAPAGLLSPTVEDTLPELTPPPAETTAPVPLATLAPPPAPDGTLAPPPAPEPPKAAEQAPPKKKAAKAKPKPAAAPEALASAKASGAGGGDLAGASGAVKDPGLSKGKIADLKSAWGAKIRARVDARKSHPRGAAGVSGLVKVRLTVARDGGLQSVSVVASSGVAALDQAALRAVKAAGRFPAAPKGLTDDSYSFTLPIRFAG